MRALFETVLSASAAGAVLVAATMAVQWAIGRKLNASWRFLLWLPVLGRLLLPVVPESPFSLFNARNWIRAEKQGALVAAVSAAEKRGGLTPNRATVFDEVSKTVEAAPSAQPTKVQHDWIATVWLGVALAMLLRLGAGSIWLRVRLRRAPEATEFCQTLDECAEALGVRAPRSRETSLVDSPALFGLFRPMLLVPPGFAQRLSDAALRDVLRHEMAHLKRRDLLLNLLIEAAVAIHWFNPLAWWAARQMRLEREIACDEMALRGSATVDAQAYGETILALLARPAAQQSVAAVVGIVEDRSLVRRRLRELSSYPRRRNWRWAGLAAAGALALCGLTNAQKPERALERDTYRAWADAFLSTRFEEFRLENKTLGQALDELRGRLPERVRDVKFLYTVETNVVPTDTLTYSVNAIGYVTSDLSDPENSVRERKLEAAVVRNATTDEVLQSIGRAAGIALPPSVEGKTVTFMQLGSGPIIQRASEATNTRTTRTSVVVNDARMLIELGKLDEAEAKLKSLAKDDPDNRAAFYYLALIKERRFQEEARKRGRSGASVSAGRSKIQRKLDSIVLERWSVANETPLSKVIMELDRFAKERDQEGRGINFIISSHLDRPGPAPVTSGFGGLPQNVDPLTGQPIAQTSSATPVVVEDYLVKIDPPLKNVRLADVLDAIVRVAKQPLGQNQNILLKYSIEDYAVVFSQRSAEAEPLYTRTYKVNPNVFLRGIDDMLEASNPSLPHAPGVASSTNEPTENLPTDRPVGSDWFQSRGGIIGVAATNSPSPVTEKIRRFFIAAGIDFRTNSEPANANAPRKALFFNERTGVLFVRATLRDLDVIESALQALNIAPPQLTFQVEALDLAEAGGFARFLQYLLAECGEYRTLLTDPEFRRLMQKLKQDGRFSFRSLPRVTTLSGRPARVSDETELAVDVVATVDRGHFLEVRSACVDQNTSERKASRTGTLFDGQTLILNLPNKVPAPNDSSLPKTLFFVTPTIIDPAGNRVFSGDSLPFDAESLPAQNAAQKF